MKAVRIYEHGGVNVLKWDEISDPKPSRNQVLIDVKSTSFIYEFPDIEHNSIGFRTIIYADEFLESIR